MRKKEHIMLLKIQGGSSSMKMNWKLKKYEFCLEPNEERDVTLVLQQEKFACIHGVVKLNVGRDGECKEVPAKCAVVKLFEKKGHDCCELIPVTFTLTDDCGQFLFKVKPCVEYVVKVFFFKPECDDDGYDCDHDHDNDCDHEDDHDCDHKKKLICKKKC
jgi:hypothetical protein